MGERMRVRRGRARRVGGETNLGVGVDIEGDTLAVEGGDLGDCLGKSNHSQRLSFRVPNEVDSLTVVVLALPLLLLELEGDTANGTLLNPLHQVGGEPSDLVAKTLGGDDRDLVTDLLVGVAAREERGVSSVARANEWGGRKKHTSPE